MILYHDIADKEDGDACLVLDVVKTEIFLETLETRIGGVAAVDEVEIEADFEHREPYKIDLADLRARSATMDMTKGFEGKELASAHSSVKDHSKNSCHRRGASSFRINFRHSLSFLSIDRQVGGSSTSKLSQPDQVLVASTIAAVVST